MTAPIRLQLSRRKGFDLQALSQATNGLPAINCARPGKWGNPFIPGRLYKTVAAGELLCEDARDAVRLFTPVAWCRKEEIKRELRDKNLACWCKPGDPCHADVLLELANR